MPKLTDATIGIIEVIASNANSGIGSKRIPRRPTRVHRVVVNSSSSSLAQKMDVLTKQMETPMKAKVQMMTPTPLPPVSDEFGETRHVVGDCPYTQALEDVKYVGANYNPYSNT